MRKKVRQREWKAGKPYKIREECEEAGGTCSDHIKNKSQKLNSRKLN